MVDSGIKAWRILRSLVIYRILLAILLVTLIVSGYLPQPIAEIYPNLFYGTVFVYVLTAFIFIYPLSLKTPHYTWQVYSITSIDIVLITLMMHASGGIGSGVGMLLVVSVANASMLLAGRMSIFFAALASIAVLCEQIYTQFTLQTTQYNYSMAGLLGLALFVTSALSAVLAKQARENADLAHERGLDLANMSELTEQVIRQMSTGVLVVDQHYFVRLINESARRLLDVQSRALGEHLHFFSPELDERLQSWLKGGRSRLVKQRLEILPASLLLQIVQINSGGDERKAGVLIFIEDAGLIDEQSRQLRLAALGRLTAGIAHEIRNPLSSIRHASALLAESPSLPAEDRRLTDIIQDNTSRVNRIVEDVLQLGNRDRVNKEPLVLNDWLMIFLEEIEYLLPDLHKILVVEDKTEKPIKVSMDTGHLRQILNNLFCNAAHFARQSTQEPKVICRLMGGHGESTFIEVLNNGPRVEREHQPRLFEPFFTTSAKGTGLGLYLSRELAQANQCHLAYQERQDLTCFRLSFGEQTLVSDA